MSSVTASSKPKIYPFNPELRERDERLDSLKMLMGRLAHDFNNYLVPLLGYVTLLKEEVTDNSSALHYANTLETATRRTEGFIDAIQTAVRPHRHFAPKLINFSESLEGAISQWMAALPDPSQLQVVRMLEPCVLFVDEALWTKVFQHLLSNARFALAMGGVLEVTLEKQKLSQEEMQDIGLQHSDVFKLVFKDNGFGMNEGTLKRAYEPFYTTRTGQKCLGLGLTTVHSVAHAHGGQTMIKSKEDSGTSVIVWIPISSPPPASAVSANADGQAPAPAAPAKKPVGKKILLVDDDPLVREVIKSHLQRSQFEVLTAADGEEGLKIFQKNFANLALVVTDITMPKMNGIDLFKSIRLMNDKARVIFISGDMEAMRESSLAELGAQRPLLIKKPFNFKTFVETVQNQIA